MKPEEQWTPLDYWNDLQKGDLETETYIRVGNELAEHAAQLEAENEALKLRTGICEWEYNEHHDKWDTSCSNAWQFIVDGPEENECQYCMYCGGVIAALLTEEKP